MASIVQSVLFNKNKYKFDDAINWLVEHNYKIKKVDETMNYLRFRQIPPITLKKKGYKTYINKNITKDIILVIAYM